jgi:acyl-coenzyme A synthetase/AMP-(fatty) acid ligase
LPRQSRETLLPDYLNSGQVTVWHSVPSLFRHFTEALSGGPVFPGIRLLLLGGEAVRRQDVQACRKFFPNATFGSIYGQTESSVNSLWLVAPRIDDYRISTGEPLDGTQLFVTDDNGSTVEPLGVGQIVVASTAIAPGYWNDPKLTRAVFSNDPELGPLYWTGDMGRLLPDGRIEFAGRRDHQVKIRGMRVELGEIECRLCDHPAVSEAIVTCREQADGLPLLACYWQARDGGRLEASEIRAHLARHLPAPMIPSHYLQVDVWPRNANGKIDRKALPDIPDGPAVLSVPAATKREEQVLALWKRVLQSDSVGLQTNFFDAGGNSLKLFKLQAVYAENSGTVIPLARFFEYPTVREFARFIDCGPRREQAPPAGRPVNRLADRKKRLERE